MGWRGAPNSTVAKVISEKYALLCSSFTAYPELGHTRSSTKRKLDGVTEPVEDKKIQIHLL